MTRSKISAFDACRRDPWAIMPESLENILTITHKHLTGDDIDLDAVSAKLGRPLENTRTVEVRDGVAVIPVSGPIFRMASLFTEISGATSIETLSTDFAEALDNPSVKSIVFDVDSPGGQVAGVQEFAAMIYEARGRKPMATYCGDLMASAALWIGTATGNVIAAHTARIGSIGVVASFDDNREAKRAVGVREFKFISSKSPRKQPDPATKEGAKDIQSMVDQLADIFIADIARNRGVGVDTVESSFGQGSVMLAEQAHSVGLIDGISTFEGVISDFAHTQTARASEGIEAGETKNKEKSQMEETTKVEPKAEPKALVIDREYLNANHADLVDTIKAEGAESERGRIIAIEDAAIPGHDDIVSAAKADGTTTAADMALQILGAQKTANKHTLESIEADAPAPVKQDEAPATTSKPKAKANTVEAEWEALAEDERDGFIGGFEAFKIAVEAEKSGQVKVL